MPMVPVLDTVEARFAAKVQPRADGCWIWTASTDGSGRYGAFYLDGRLERAHRVAYELSGRGPIPPGMVIDHLCRVTLCVNPDHLEVVTQHQNIMRGTAASARNAVKTHCMRGHELSGENVQIMARGGRRCLACTQTPEFKARRAAQNRARRARKRAGETS